MSVKNGAYVEQGEPVLILNAMKMEHVVNAPSSGKISLGCEEGQMVMDGQVLAEIEAEEDKEEKA